MEIVLTRGKYTVVDDEFYEVLAKYKWYLISDGSGLHCYAARKSVASGKRITILMHRVILELAGIVLGELVDHRDGDGLNNRLANLRPASRSENLRNQRLSVNNKSGFKGVDFQKKRNKWRARICAGNFFSLGYFNTAEEAAAAYNEAASRLHGEFARLNALG